MDADAAIPQPHDLLLEQFGQSAYDFLDAAIGVWPDDSVLKSGHAAWTEANKEPATARAFTRAVHDAFQAQFKPYISRLLKQDASVLEEEIPFLTSVDAAAKYASLDAATRDTVWAYTRKVVQAASVNDVYEKCPRQVVDLVSSMASGIVADVQSGKFDPSQLNPAAITQQLMGALRPEDIQAWGQRLTADGGLDGLMTVMTTAMSGGLDLGGAGSIDPAALQSIMGSLGAMTGGGGGGGGAMPDISTLMQFASQMMKKEEKK